MEETEETKTETDEGDPGVVIFADPDAIHAALALGSVANIVLPIDIAPHVPVLQQGKLKSLFVTLLTLYCNE